jgi:glycerol-3-phosphate dehydrogenase
VLRLEIVHAIECEQAETIEDVLRRRVELEATPSHGKEALGITKSELARKFSLEELQVQEAAWLEHLHAVGELIR